MVFKVNLFLIGMQKSGSTSIFNFLKQCNEISCSNVKETNVFSDDKLRKNITNKHTTNIYKPDDLSKFFSINNQYQYYLEGSINHFYSRGAPLKLYKYNPNAKLILIVRDPIERIISHYKMDLNLGFNGISLNQSLNHEMNTSQAYGSDLGYIEMSYVEKYLDNWLKYFDKNNILILNFNDLNNHTKITKHLSDFLNIKINQKFIKQYNIGRVPKYKYITKLLFFFNYKGIISKFMPDLLKSFLNTLFYSRDLPSKVVLNKNIENNLIDKFHSDKIYTSFLFKK